MPHLDAYREKYECARLERADGVLEVTLHGDGGPLVWNETTHRELPALWVDIADDPETKVVLLTGTGEVFCSEIDRASYEGFNLGSHEGYHKIYVEGKRLLQNLLEIEVPMVAAINGPARIHAEIPLLCDIIVASEDTVFQDAAHFRTGSVSGDGVHVVWPALLGPNRGRYFLMMAEEITAREAQQLGVVGEVVGRDELMPRARQIAAELAALPDLTLRYTRIALTQRLKEDMLSLLGHGLILEGSAARGAGTPS
jgi:enoyl-CoA hydratase/carnithine racemase